MLKRSAALRRPRLILSGANRMGHFGLGSMFRSIGSALGARGLRRASRENSPNSMSLDLPPEGRTNTRPELYRG
jgi:hypothetical protein